MDTTLKEKIALKQAHLAVIGMGYVGLPLAIEMAQAGFKVTGIDVDLQKIAKVQQGISYIQDVSHEKLSALVDQGRLSATADFSILTKCDTISICVPTPLRKTKDPDISYIISTVQEIKRYLRPGHLIVLESTTYPGTTDEILLPRFQETGYQVGQDFFLAFSPERVDPGNTVYTTRNTPKIIGGITENCAHMARLLYESFLEKVIVVSSTKSAEMVKLLENTFRSVNIGLVNEIALMCDRLKIDVWEVIDAAASKPFGFMPFYPGPGLGGHCIPIDPVFLSWKLKTLNYNARFIELASEINANMPLYVVSKIVSSLNWHQKAVNGSRIMIMGISYKKDISDTRESPAIDIAKLLLEQGALVEYHDPLVPELKINSEVLQSGELEAATISRCDAVVITTDHSCFDIKLVIDHAQLIIDTRNATRHFPNQNHVVKI
ncbi:nucleotide sugar dehydrogenase [candidate division CSSED10-310 bacterium]|uniref:Nucleotide sugar dehydrogenase n=1 Tax=candidate division CSSED10-310 bacterium TaxID=2855610 RepID=A0ABV6Z435_UNCC1